MTPARFFVLMTALFAALGAWFVPRMDASGDEPHYLLMAQSLWNEGDLDLRDNYAREDWRAYRAGAVDPHYAAPRLDGRPFPGHSPGLSFLLSPVYALGGRLACVILLGAMVAGVGALTMRVALDEGLNRPASLLAGVLGSGPPLAAFALHTYTEAACALAAFAAYALLRKGGGARSALAAALACALPFLHPRMAVVSVAIAIAAFLLRERVSLRAFAVVTGIGALLYGGFWMSIYGTPTGLGVYGGVPEDAAFNPLQAAIGLLVDRAYGLLPIAPVFFVIALIPMRETASVFRRVEWILILAILLPVLFWRMWWGGQSPPARLIAPMTPFLALAVARLWFRTDRRIFRVSVVGGLVWSWFVFLFCALQPGRLLFINRRVRPTRIWDALWPGGPLDALLPDMARPLAHDWTLAVVWGAILGACVFWSRSRSS